jgi:DHA1 family multidrug resistance protein-like MFS transporter
MSAGFNLGAVLGPIVGGRIGDIYGLRYSYYAAGVIFFLSLIVISFIRAQPVEKQVPSQDGPRWYMSSRYLVYMGVIFLAFFAMYLPQPLTPNYLSNQGGYDLSQIGVLFSVSSVGVVVLNLVLGSLPALTGFLIAQFAVALFTLILWRTSGFAWYFVGFFMLGGFRTARNLGVAQVRQLVPSSIMGLAYGVTETVAGTAVILAPILAGFLYTQNPSIMYAIGFGLIIVSIVISGRYSPKPGDVEFSPGAPPAATENGISDG